MSEPIHLLSLGAGVQSSVMALMAAHGEITPMPQAAIFADTQDEPKAVYDWLDWLKERLPFPVYRVTAGKLSTHVLRMKVTKDGRAFSTSSVPFFTRNHDGSQGKIVHRGCTRDFKIAPILKKARKMGRITRGQKTVGVIQWIGISLDEATRMKPSREAWCRNRWPLIELEMKRHDCLRWMDAHNYPRPPRSACIYCPFHNNDEWRRLKTEAPDEFTKAVRFERRLQRSKAKSQNFRTVPFLHRSLVPLDQVDFSTLEERGQLNFFQNECEGMCGV